jgi:hypothetical protein
LIFSTSAGCESITSRTRGRKESADGGGGEEARMVESSDEKEEVEEVVEVVVEERKSRKRAFAFVPVIAAVSYEESVSQFREKLCQHEIGETDQSIYSRLLHRQVDQVLQVQSDS